MKRYTFGLLTGLLVGFLGVLAYTHGSPKAADPDSEAAPSTAGRRPKRRSLTSSPETRLEVARLDLRSLLAEAPPEAVYERHLDFLKRAIFDRDWDRVRVAAEGLESLREARATAAEKPSEDTSDSAEAPAIVIRHRLASRAFWKERKSHRNAATRAQALEADDTRLAELQKLLQDSDAALVVRQDAALWLGRSCGASGLQILAATAINARVEDLRRLAIDAIARSGQPQAAATLGRLSSPDQEPAVQRLAVRALPLIEDVVAGGESLRPLLAALNRERPAPLRQTALQAAGQVDWLRSEPLSQTIVGLIKSEREALELRLDAIAAGRSSARVAMSASPTLRQGLESLVSGERDGPLREAALEALGEIGDAGSLSVIEDAAPTAASPTTRQAFERARRALSQKFRGS